MPLKDFIIINFPVWIFYIFSFTALFISFFFAGIIKYILLGFSWWCFCGAFFVFTDYKRKKKIYYKILTQSKNSYERAKRLTIPLKDTICGIALSLAINHRVKNLMN